MPISTTDIKELASLVAAALIQAEVDAKEIGGLIFRPEWRPTPRNRANIQPKATSRRKTPFFKNRPPFSKLKPQSVPPPLSPSSSTISGSPPTSASTPLRSTMPTSSSKQEPLPEPQLQDGPASELVKTNRKEFDDIIYHSFPQSLGEGTASLDGFRYYMIQDKFYLETCAQLKMMSVIDSDFDKDIKTFNRRHDSSVKYVTDLEEICVTQLGIPKSAFKDMPRSVQLDTSQQFYKDTLRKEDALLAYYVVLFPCILSYWTIADRLTKDKSTVENVVYHKAWIEVNNDSSSVDKYTKFINENINAKGGLKKWNHIFRIACLLEADLFNTGKKAPSPFKIIPDGTYYIQSSTTQKAVLAVQDTKGFLQPPLDSDRHLKKYLPSDAGLSIVGVNKTGGDNEKWRAVATERGYTFQNVETNLYLAIESRREFGGILHVATTPYHWWINPVEADRKEGQTNQQSSLHKIHESSNLRYSLHAATEDVSPANAVESNNLRYTPIITKDNFEGTCQMWSFSDAPNDSGPTSDKSKIYIAVMGMTKSGKSTFINLATQSETQKLRVGHALRSCTDTVEFASPFMLDDRQVVLFETPGFGHNCKSEVEILGIIAAELEILYRYPKGIKLHGIVYLHNISDTRVDNSAIDHFHAFRKLCGDQAIKNVVIVTNMWGKVDKEVAEERARSLASIEGFFKPALLGGARLMHHSSDTVGSAHQIIRSTIGKLGQLLAIQEELVDRHVDINKTTVGIEVDRILSERLERYEDDLTDLLKRSEKERVDEETRMELLDEGQKVRDTIARLGNERMKQSLMYKHRLQQHI